MPNKFGKWGLDLWPTEEGVLIIKDLIKNHGLMNKLKQDDDGYYLTLSRPIEKKFGAEITKLNPPVVMSREGIPVTNVQIGNGSDVTCKVWKYSFKPLTSEQRKVAIRLEAVRIDNLIPYKSETDMRDFQKEQVKGLMEAKQPEPLF
jgi:hypothetical protein